jgi:hypothetical protein
MKPLMTLINVKTVKIIDKTVPNFTLSDHENYHKITNKINEAK